MAAGRRILVAYLVFYGALGAAFPYLPVYLREQGLALDRIGLLAAVGALVQLLAAPLWGGLSDRFPRSRLGLPLAALVAAVGAAMLVLAADFASVLAGWLVLYAGVAGIAPGLDARTLEVLGPERRGRFGQVRAFGSLAFVVIAVGVGLVLDAYGARSLFWIYLPGLLLTALVTALIPRGRSVGSASPLRGAARFLAVPGVGLFFVGFGIAWASLAAITAFYSIQIIALGGSPSMAGGAWALAALVEVPLMYAFPRVAARVGTERLVVAGCVGMAVRAGLAAVAPSAVALVAIGTLEGLSFAFLFVGGVTVVATWAPAGLGGTAQGLLSASAGLATIVGSTVGGVAAEVAGIAAMFAGCAVVALAGAAVVAIALLRPGTDRPTVV